MSAVLPDFPSDWRVQSARLIADTAAGTVYEAVTGDNRQAVIKQFKPKGTEAGVRGGAFLDWRGGAGCIRLLDRSGDMHLLEHAGHLTLLDHLQTAGDAAASLIAADVVARCHAPCDRVTNGEFLPINDYFASLFSRAERDRGERGSSPFIDGALVAMMLIDNQRDVRPLHGDLHHENIMLGPRGWLAIDPVGLIGDPALDVANMLYNPIARPDLTRDPERIAATAERLGAAVGRDIRTVLRYAFAYGCLSAAWFDEDGAHASAIGALQTARAIEGALRLV